MPALFSLGHHGALCAVNRRLLPTERQLASLGSHLRHLQARSRFRRVCGAPRRVVGPSRTQVHKGKTQLWHRSGSPPCGRQALTAVARISDPETAEVLGTPLGHTEFLKAHLRVVSDSHSVLCERIPSVPDLQLAWLLLIFCAATRANCLFCNIPRKWPTSTPATTMSQLLDVAIPGGSWAVAYFPPSIGGRSASRMSTPTYWVSGQIVCTLSNSGIRLWVIRSPLRCDVAGGFWTPP